MSLQIPETSLCALDQPHVKERGNNNDSFTVQNKNTKNLTNNIIHKRLVLIHFFEELKEFMLMI